MKFYYTYVLLSQFDNKYYVGSTSNLEKRVLTHNLGLVKSTKKRRPLKLIYYEACLDKLSSIIREKQLKTGFGRAYLKRRLNKDLTANNLGQ